MYINYGFGQGETYEERIRKIQEQLEKLREFLTTKKPILTPEQREVITKATQPIPAPLTPTPTPIDIKSLLPLGLLGGFIYFVSRPKEGKVIKSKRRY
jgi:hypothetical protein